MAASGRDHILQQSGWAALKAATGWHASRFTLVAGGATVGLCQVLFRRLPLGLTVAYAPRGPLVDPSRLPPALAALRRALAAGRCVSLLCDPEVPDTPETRRSLAGARVARASVFVQPRRTLLMDLAHEPEALLSAMRRKTRQYVRKAERAGVVTEETADLDRFLAVLRAVAERDRFAIHDRAYFVRLLAAFPGRVHLLMARLGPDDAGALLVVRSHDRAWEMFGGWNGAHADARPFYLLKWRSLLLMRSLGVRRYDMWGLADRAQPAPGGDRGGRTRNETEKPDVRAAGAPLAGVESFKLGFGGEAVEWIGALETPVRRALFPLWQLGARRRLARSA